MGEGIDNAIGKVYSVFWMVLLVVAIFVSGMILAENNTFTFSNDTNNSCINCSFDDVSDGASGLVVYNPDYSPSLTQDDFLNDALLNNTILNITVNDTINNTINETVNDTFDNSIIETIIEPSNPIIDATNEAVYDIINETSNETINTTFDETNSTNSTATTNDASIDTSQTGLTPILPKHISEPNELTEKEKRLEELLLAFHEIEYDNNQSQNTSQNTSVNKTIQDINPEGKIRVLLIKKTQGKIASLSTDTSGKKDSKTQNSKHKILKINAGKKDYKIEQETNDIIALYLNESEFSELQKTNIFTEAMIDEKLNALELNALNIVSDTSALDLTNVTLAKGSGLDGSNIKVCIPDTGINANMLGLVENETIYGQNFIAVNQSSIYQDDNGHGTSIANVLLSIAPQVTIYAPKVLDSQGVGYASNILAGIEYCMNNDVDIISISFGGSLADGYCDSDPVAALLNNASFEHGIFVASAAGNDASNSSIRSPACGSYVARVGASTKQDTIAAFSNTFILDLVAPGLDILTVDKNGNNQSASGTSISVPIVSGIAALKMQDNAIRNDLQNSSIILTPSELLTALKENAFVIENNNTNNTTDIYYRINALTNQILNNLTNYTAPQVTISQGYYNGMFYREIGPFTPGGITTASVSGVTNTSTTWTGTVNEIINDDICQTANSVKVNTLGILQVSYALYATNFGFAGLPTSGIKITGITLNMRRGNLVDPTSRAITDYAIRLVNGSAKIFIGENKTKIANWGAAASCTYFQYGNSTDNWNYNWTPQDVMGNTFGVGIFVKTTGTGGNGYPAISYVTMNVSYNYIPLVPIQISQTFQNLTTAHGFNFSVRFNDTDNATDIVSSGYVSNDTSLVCTNTTPAISGFNYTVNYSCIANRSNVVNFTVYVVDSAGSNVSANRYVTQIPNNRPEPNYLRISHANPYRKTDTIYIANAGNCTDPDGDSVTHYYNFTNSTGGVLQSWQTQGLAPSYYCGDKDACYNGMIINVSYKCDDGLINSTVLTDYFIIGGQGPMNPGTLQDVAISNTHSWTSVSNANDSDNKTSNVSFTTYKLSSTLRAKNFGFTLDSASKVTGIMVDIERSQNSVGAPYVTDYTLNLTSGVNTLKNEAAWPTDDTLYIYGNNSYTWGTTWRGSDITPSTFGFDLRVNATQAGAGLIAKIDQIRVAVFDNIAPVATPTLTIVNDSTGHAFNVTAIAYDLDGILDLTKINGNGLINSTMNITGASSSCIRINATNNSLDTATVLYRCNGTVNQQATLSVYFNDSVDNLAETLKSVNTYPNHKPVAISFTKNVSTTMKVNEAVQITSNSTSDDDSVDTVYPLFQYLPKVNGNLFVSPDYTTDPTYTCQRSLGCNKSTVLNINMLANDGYDNSSSYITSTIAIINTPPVIYANITFSNYSINHTFNVTAQVSDADGPYDIRRVTILNNSALNSIVSCTQIYNTTADPVFTSVFACNGTPNTNANLSMNFSDNETYAYTAYAINNIPNNIPIIDTLSFNDTIYSENSIINASAVYHDLDNVDSLVMYYKYTLSDGTILQNFSTVSTFNCSANPLCGSNMTINLTAYVNDSYNISSTTMINVSIGNSPPSILSQITFVNATTSHSFTVTANVSDINGADDIINATINSAQSLNCSNITRTNNITGVVFNCSGTSYDSLSVNITFIDSWGASATTQTKTNSFPNNAPINLGIYFSGVYNKTSTLAVIGNASDADGDTLHYFYQFKNQTGSILQDFTEDANTFNCSENTGCRWNFTMNVSFYVSDDFDSSSIALNNTKIQNSPPVNITGIIFTNYSFGNKFYGTVNITEFDGADTNIKLINITSTSGTCVKVSNTTYGDISGIVPYMYFLFNCTGSGLVNTNITVNFTDKNNSVLSIAGSYTYPDNNPSLSTPTFTQSSYNSTQDVEITTTVTDTDSNTVNATFYWYINGKLLYTDNQNNKSNGSVLTSTLISTMQYGGDRIYVNVSVIDQFGLTNSSISTTTAVNDADRPTATNISESSSIFFNTTNITFSARVYDEDGVWYAYLETNESGAMINYTTITSGLVLENNYSVSTNSKDLVFVNNSLKVLNSSGFIGFYNSSVIVGNMSITTADNDISGITYLNGKYYVLGNQTDKIYEYYSNGSLTGLNFSSPDTNSTGITYANGNFYISSYNKIYKYNLTGNSTNTNFSTSQGACSGLSYMNPFLYVLCNGTIYRYMVNGTLNDLFFNTTNENITGISIAQGRIYLLDSAASKIYYYSNATTHQSSTIVNSPAGEYNTVTFDWFNGNLVDLQNVGWRIHVVDYAGNDYNTSIMTFRAAFNTNTTLTLFYTNQIPDMTQATYNTLVYALLSNNGAANISSAIINLSSLPAGWTTNYSGNVFSCGVVENFTTCSVTYNISIPGNTSSGDFYIDSIASWNKTGSLENITSPTALITIADNPELQVNTSNIAVTQVHNTTQTATIFNITDWGNIDLLSRTNPITYNASGGNLSANWITFTPASRTMNLTRGQTKNVTVNVSIPVGTAPGIYLTTVNTYVRDNIQFAHILKNSFNISVTVNSTRSWNVTSSLITAVDQGVSDYPLGTINVTNTGNVPVNINLVYSSDFDFDFIPNPFSIDPQTTTEVAATILSIPGDQTSAIYPYNITVRNGDLPTDKRVISADLNVTNTPPNITLAEISSVNPEVNSVLTITANATDIGGIDAAWYNMSIDNSGNITYEYGIMTLMGSGLYEANYTPLYAYTYSVVVFVNDSQNAISNSSSTTLEFVPIDYSFVYPTVNATSVSVNDITYYSGKTISINLTLSNNELSNAYLVTTNWTLSNNSWNISPANSTHGTIPTMSTNYTLYNITIPSGTAPGNYNATFYANWKNPDNTFDSYSVITSVTVGSNPSFDITYGGTATISHNASSFVNIQLNNSGNSNINNTVISCSSGPICSIFNASLNVSLLNLSAGQIINLSLNVSVPLRYAPGTYAGLINATGEKIEDGIVTGYVTDQLTVSVIVPSDGSWDISSTYVNSSVGENNDGTVNVLTISNYGNIDLIFNVNSTNSSIIYANVSQITVTKGSNNYITINYSSPNASALFSENITISNSSASPSSRILLVDLDVVNLLPSILSPTESEPLINLIAADNVTFYANVSLDGNELTSNITWDLFIANESTICNITNQSYTTSNYTIICTLPNVADGYSYDAILRANYTPLSALSKTTQINSIKYADLTAPSINSISFDDIVESGIVLININATDNVNVSTATFNMTYQDGTSTLQNISIFDGYYFWASPWFPPIGNGQTKFPVGDYDVFYQFVDDAGNQANYTDYLEVYTPINLTGAIRNTLGNEVNVSVTLTRPYSSINLFNFTAGEYNYTSGEIHKRDYGVKIDQTTNSITLHNATFNENLTDLFVYQSFTENIISIPLYRELTGFYMQTNLTADGNITINFSNTTIFADKSYVRLLKCADWVVNNSVSSCLSGWVNYSSYVKNNTLSIITANISGFSAYVAAEYMCGNGVCQPSYDEDISSCAADCNTGGSGNSGGGGGGGGGARFTGNYSNTTINQTALELEINKTRESLERLGNITKDVSLSQSNIDFDLKQGENYTKSITLANNKDYAISVTLSLSGKATSFVSLNDYDITLLPGAKSIILVTANIPTKTNPASYDGKINLVYSNNVTDSIAVKVIVRENLELGPPKPSYAETIAGLLGKTYVLQLIIMIIIAIMFFTAVYKSYEYMRKRRRYQFKVNQSLLPKKSDRSIFIGKLAEGLTDAHLELDRMQTHTIVAGATGAGKSVAAQVIIEEALRKNVAVVVFDPTAQWSGFLRPCTDNGMFAKYRKFGLRRKDAKGFNGNVYQINNALEIIEIDKFLKPGEIHIFSIHKMDPSQVDIFVANTVRQIFLSNPQESATLKYLIVYDEVHRLLPKFGGSGQGFIQVERACREFRKWGIGLVLISQVLSDFVGEIKANIGTQIQLRTADESDLERLRIKYGEDIVKSIVKADTGIGMIENPSYNKGLPYFVSMRPLLHSITRLPDSELEKYDHYNKRMDDINYQLEQLESYKVDIFEIKIELGLATDKLKIGKFDMVEIYVESIENVLKKYWTKLGKQPKKREVKMTNISELQKSVEAARMERQKVENLAKNEVIQAAQKMHSKLHPHNLYFIDYTNVESMMMVLSSASKVFDIMVLSPRKITYSNLTFKSLSYINITMEPGPKNTSPQDLKVLNKKIEDFISAKTNSIIMIDDVLKLREYHDFDVLIKMISDLKNSLKSKNAILVLSLNNLMIKQKEIDKLKSFGEFID